MGVSLIVSLAILGYGLYNFLTQWQYSENGHEYLLIAYVVGTVLTFLALRLSRLKLAFTFMAMIACILLYSNTKFDWRANYINDAEKGRYFEMGQYIDQYPTFEEHTFASITGTPKIVDFNTQCYKPLLSSKNLNATLADLNYHCKSSETIRNFYGVDVRNIIQSHYKKMQNTAKQLEKGRLNSKRKFENCIKNKKCVMIPLLPAEAKDVKQQSEDYIDIRKQFWTLINDKKMSKQNCAFFDFCRVMIESKIINFEKL